MTITLDGTAGATISGGTTISGDMAFNSGYGSAAVAYGCRAWVNFNGTGTVAIRASGNVSSITDNGVGNYTVNFSTAMPDANYSAVTTAQFATVNNFGFCIESLPTANGVVVGTRNTSNAAAYDSTSVCVAIFR